MSNTKTLVVELSLEDSNRLAVEAKRRQINATTLAQILLHDSITKLNSVFSPIPQLNNIQSLPTLYKNWRQDSVNKEFIRVSQVSLSPDTIRFEDSLVAGTTINPSEKKEQYIITQAKSNQAFLSSMQVDMESLNKWRYDFSSLPKQNLTPSPNLQVDMESLQKLYNFRGVKTAILQFIKQHHFLLPILLEAPEKIRRYFPDSDLFIEVVTDPEGIDDTMLELAICMNIAPDEAVDRLNQFQDNWWLNVSSEMRKPLCPILEYADDF